MTKSATRVAADKVTFTQAEVTAKDTAARAGRKNLIINGAMQVAQRGTSFTGLTSGQHYVSDRFENQLSSAGTFTFDNTNIAPDGFSNSQRMNCTTAFSVASGTYLIFRHDIEGQNLQEAAFGTSAAKQMTLSFWCRSTKTGSLSVVVRQPDASNRMFSKNVTINTANTWEKKTILIPADTGGTINNDNGSGLQVAWWLNGGSTYGGGSEQTAWGTQTNTNKYTGTINLGASTSDQFYLTGVQLEVGSVATDFEHRSYGEILADCQRYFYKPAPLDFSAQGTHWSGNNGYMTFHFPVPMRAKPSYTDSGSGTYKTYYNGIQRVNGGQLGDGGGTHTEIILLNSNINSPSTFVRLDGSDKFCSFDAEL